MAYRRRALIGTQMSVEVLQLGEIRQCMFIDWEYGGSNIITLKGLTLSVFCECLNGSQVLLQ